MNRRSRQQPEKPLWKNAWNAAFDIREESPQQETINQLVVANNTTVSVIEEFQQRYESLSEQEKRRVNSHLQNVRAI